MEEILTIPEVAEFLKLSKSKVYKMVQRGEIPSMKLGKNVRLRRTDVLDWLMFELMRNVLIEEDIPQKQDYRRTYDIFPAD